MAQASIRSSVATRAAAAGTVLAVTRAPTVAVGDVLAVHLGYTGAVGVIAPPPGWSLWFATSSSSICSQAWYWRIATTGDLSASTYTFSWAASTSVVAHCHAIQNCDDDPASWIKIQSIGTSAAPTATALVAQQPTCFLLHGTTTVVVSGVTPPASYTEVVDTDGTVATPNTIRISDATLGQTADGTTGAVASSIGSSQAWVASLIVIPSADYPVFRAATTGTTTIVTANVTVPAGTLAGEFRLVAIRIPNQTTTVTTPSGWTLIGPQASNATGAFRVYWFWRIAAGSAGMPTTDATQAFTLSTAVTTVGWQSSTVRRTHATTPVGASALNANAATATTYAHPGVTTANANSLVLTSFHASSAATWTPPTNYTERSDATNNEVADRVVVSAGATGTLTGTLSVTGFGVGLALEVRYGATPAAPTIPTWRASIAAVGGGSSVSLVLGKAIGTLEGDLMLHDISDVHDTSVVTPPAGFTLVAALSVTNTGTSPDHRLLRYAKVAGPGEPVNYTYSFSIASSVQGQSHSFAGTPGLTSFGPGSSASGNSTTLSTAGITTTNANSLLVYLSTRFAAAMTAAPPAGMTLGLQAQNQQMSWERIVSAGATGTRSQTITTDQWTAAMVELSAIAIGGAGPFPLPTRKPSHQLVALLRR